MPGLSGAAGVNAHLANHATRFFVRVNGEVYKYLHAKHGGGPAVQQLSTCIPCEVLIPPRGQPRRLHLHQIRNTERLIQKSLNRAMIRYCL